MGFQLRDLEAILPREMVSRGLDYFAADRVLDLAGREHFWTATVEGTYSYRIEIVLTGEAVQRWSCSCPYDQGPLCKHVAAVLFAIRSREAERNLRNMLDGRRTPKEDGKR